MYVNQNDTITALLLIIMLQTHCDSFLKQEKLIQTIDVLINIFPDSLLLQKLQMALVEKTDPWEIFNAILKK